MVLFITLWCCQCTCVGKEMDMFSSGCDDMELFSDNHHILTKENVISIIFSLEMNIGSNQFFRGNLCQWRGLSYAESNNCNVR